MKTRLFAIALLIGSTVGAETFAETRSVEVDVAVYAATPSGILAAIAVKREGRSVVIVEPSRWVGGMLGAGLKPIQDCPNVNATGGMTRPLLESLGKSGGHLTGDPRSLDPSAIRADFEVR